jgi:ADP-ribosylglycohydrolase
MLGAIVGDVIGSVHEAAGTKTKDFPLFTPRSRFTDDTVLTVAVADALLNGREYAEVFHEYYHAYPRSGFGGGFIAWARTSPLEPYNSYGNGSAMRVSPVAYARDTLDDVVAEAKRSAEATHNHPEGIKGAQAVAAAVFLARTGSSKDAIREHVTRAFGYDLDRDLDELRKTYTFDVTCQGSVPESIVAFLASEDFEDAVRNAISLGGDADTMACMAGAIAEPFYGGVPPALAEEALARLPEPMRELLQAFQRQFGR